jgi:ABC-type spermidine/putrescine transport system permease subunit II
VGKRLLQAHAILVYLFLYAPIVIVVIYSFNSGRQVLNWQGFSTKWFGEALADETITEPFRNSLVIAFGAAIISCVLGTALAIAVSKMPQWVRVPIDSVVYMTLVTPEIVFGIAALMFFVQASNQLVTIGLIDEPLRGLWKIMVAHVVFNASVVALIVRARFVSMGQTHEEASFDLGAGPVKTFVQVTLPRLAPAILAGGLLAFTFSFDDFITSFFVADAGTTTLPLRIFSSLRFGISPLINATAVMILGLTLIAIIVAYLVLRRTEAIRRQAAVVPGV